MNAPELQQHILDGMPITQHMGFRVLELSPNHILVAGNGQQNMNVHGTAFAGSLYTLCTLAAWGLVTSRLPDGVDLVLANAKIEYRRPVNGDIQAYCTISANHLDEFLQHLAIKRKAVLLTRVEVREVGELAVLFRAKLHAKFR